MNSPQYSRALSSKIKSIVILSTPTSISASLPGTAARLRMSLIRALAISLFPPDFMISHSATMKYISGKRMVITSFAPTCELVGKPLFSKFASSYFSNVGK